MLKFAVIGHPVAHSLSPAIHAANFRALGIDASYEAFDFAPEALADGVARLVLDGYAGFNVTVPHKRAMVDLVALGESAARYLAVNTVKVERDGTMRGYNTDVDGFLDDLAANGFGIRGSRVLVMGAGGAGSAVARGCLEAGALDVTIANRTPRDGMLPLGSELCRRIAEDADLVVNATSVGLRPDDPAPIEVKFSPRQTVYDLAPVRWTTAIVKSAREAGAKALSGHGMLVRQAARAFAIWTGMEADVEAMFEGLRRELDRGA